VGVNFALSKHVETFIVMPFATLFNSLPIPSAFIAVICALAARDHEDYMHLKKDKST
jgi:hypothetical protein